MNITLTNLVLWLIIGLIAGWLAGEVTRGVGFGTLGNIVVGIIGAFVGGIVLGSLGVDPGGFVGEVIQAFLGALVFLALVSVLRGGTRATV